jgi:hypothetical protein
VNDFGMVTTQHSHACTAHARERFLERTPFALAGLFGLIVTDGTCRVPADGEGLPVARLTNAAPFGAKGVCLRNALCVRPRNAID